MGLDSVVPTIVLWTAELPGSAHTPTHLWTGVVLLSPVECSRASSSNGAWRTERESAEVVSLLLTLNASLPPAFLLFLFSIPMHKGIDLSCWHMPPQLILNSEVTDALFQPFCFPQAKFLSMGSPNWDIMTCQKHLCFKLIPCELMTKGFRTLWICFGCS